MFWTLIEKEWKNVAKSPKFVATCGVSCLLILASVLLGIRELRAFEDQQAAARALLAEELEEVSDWTALAARAFRHADALSVLAGGVHNDVGRLATIDRSSDPALVRSIYSDEPILAVFRSLDLSFIVTVVLSLFAILFTYDAINGERQAGTLRLIFAHAIPRARYVTAKLAGLWVAAAIPLLLSALLGLLAAELSGVSLIVDHWQRLLAFGAAAALYFTFFVVLGVAASALTRRPATSFLALLAVWVLLVMVIPRVGLLAAIRLQPVPSAAEIESRKQGFEARAWDDHLRELSGLWQQRETEMAGLDDDQRQAYEDERLWKWLEEDERLRKETEATIADNAARLDETVRLTQAKQTRLAFGLSRLSPASTFQLLAMRVAGTGTELKERYEEALRLYRQSFLDFVASRDGGQGTSHRITRRRASAAPKIFEDTDQPLDLSDMPRFIAPRLDTAGALAGTPMELGLLALEVLLAFAAGFVAFLRYDVR